MVPSNISYDDILERHGGAGGIPDPSHLTTMAKDLKQLCDLASTRNETCNAGMRALAEKRKDVLEEEREREQQEQASRAREAEEREILKRKSDDEDEDARGRKGTKVKKRKESSSVREERPPNHGAHGLARQDGLDLPLKGTLDSSTLSIARYVLFYGSLVQHHLAKLPFSLSYLIILLAYPNCSSIHHKDASIHLFFHTGRAGSRERVC